jgi:hypothetical protein
MEHSISGLLERYGNEPPATTVEQRQEYAIQGQTLTMVMAGVSVRTALGIEAHNRKALSTLPPLTLHP